MFQEGLFWVLASIAVLSALMVVLLNNPVRCVLFLVLTFIATSGLWLLAYAEFLALVLVLVYVGAVMTLFLFVIMMLDTETMQESRYLKRYIPFGLAIVAFFTALVVMVLKPEHLNQVLTADVVNNPVSNTESLGLVLYTTYAYPLEVAAVLLLVAIVSAIVLAHRPPRNSKTQQLSEQLNVTKADRLRVIKMPSQNKQ